jgi:hypothetical protein
MKHTLGFAAAAACAMLGSACTITQVSPVGFGTLPEGYTCCNLHHVDDWISDGNWSDFPIIPAGTPIKVVGYGINRAHVEIDGKAFRIGHDYGRAQEPLDQFVAKLVVKEDPRGRIAAYPDPIREAIHLGRLRPGMTREQALITAGYPATHRTPVLDAPVWTYWHDRLTSYEVTWDSAGRIQTIASRP